MSGGAELAKKFFEATEVTEALTTFQEFKANAPEATALESIGTLRGHGPAARLGKELAELLAGCRNRYQVAKSLEDLRTVVVGIGPGGLMAAIVCSLAGAKVTMIERRLRDPAARNNVLRLWSPVVQELEALGLKRLWPQFCNASNNTIAIRRLQLLLTKIALLLGVEIQLGVSFEGFAQALAEDSSAHWRLCTAQDGSQWLDCDVCIGADGEGSVKRGVAKSAHFITGERKYQKAIGLTFNFIRPKHDTTTASERKIAKQYDKEGLFERLREKTGLSLENIVYFKEETHYFVMAAQPQSLYDSGVLRYDPTAPLSPVNWNNEKFQEIARDVAELVGLPRDLAFACKTPGKPDMGIFDFTSKHYCTTSLRLLDIPSGLRLPVLLVGDAVTSPFWPHGTGANRAILGALDAVHLLVELRKARMNSHDQIHAKERKVLNEAERLAKALREIDGEGQLCKNEVELRHSRGASTMSYKWSVAPLTRYKTVSNPPRSFGGLATFGPMTWTPVSRPAPAEGVFYPDLDPNCQPSQMLAIRKRCCFPFCCCKRRQQGREMQQEDQNAQLRQTSMQLLP